MSIKQKQPIKKKYYINIVGNDTFFVCITVEASNIELAMSEALRQLDAYAKQTIEQLQITSIRTHLANLK
jgi:hypothetical protein